MDEIRQLLDLALADAAAIERIVEHHGEQLDGPALAVHDNVDRLSHAVVVLRTQWTALRLTQRPAAD